MREGGRAGESQDFRDLDNRPVSVAWWAQLRPLAGLTLSSYKMGPVTSWNARVEGGCSQMKVRMGFPACILSSVSLRMLEK